ncbi:hypothetical protein [Streptomyces sp. sk2.1]|uniref:hypothetical protein n=1 Tax=Streptomyces sp. sk2.1 TaxID=2478959 RepID=UPI0011E88991|nr:hypothetical protein [Streptomyces sp. sk2.1]TXS78646.1 hypothetical protein EAO76_09800 [Streptomyces sp. sk2.1]
MTSKPETLANLVAEAVDGGDLTFAQLSDRAIDPESGYQPGANLLWKVARQKGIKLNPGLVRAIAAGLRVPPERAAAAAAYEFAGFVATGVEGGTVVHEEGADIPEASKSRAIMASWGEEELQVPYNGSTE